MWPFGRKREPVDETRCAECGRTLLAGEWTQRLIDDDGAERFICSLCAQAHAVAADDGAPIDDADMRTPTNERDGKRKSDAFWRVLKEKDAEIEDLQARLAQSEVEKEALLAELAGVRGAADATITAESGSRDEAAPQATAAAESVFLPAQLEDATQSAAADGEGGGEETEAAAATETDASLAAQREAATDAGSETAAVAAGVASGHDADGKDDGGEDTLPGTVIADEFAPQDGAEQELVGEGSETGQEAADSDEEYLTEEELHLLQRGVDVLNVSPVPKKIAETSENLGVPFVHVAVRYGTGVDVTFVWPLGWYRFAVSPEGSGSVRLADRGYEELAGVKPNGVVRSDGTVQLSPTFGKRPTPKEETAADTEPSVSTASVTSGVIISKSLMGQRTDDEAVVPWENQNARDFDWGR